MKRKAKSQQDRVEPPVKLSPEVVAASITLLTRKQVADRLQTCTHTVARYSNLGLLACVRINRRVIRYRPEDVDAFIKNSIHQPILAEGYEKA